MTNAAWLIAEECAFGVALEVRIWSPDAAKLPPQLRKALQQNQLEVARILLSTNAMENFTDVLLNPFAEEHDDLDERDAIQNEERYGTPRDIREMTIIDGLLTAPRRA